MDASTGLRIARSLIILALMAGLFIQPPPAYAATLIVNTTDDSDDGTCDAHHCSLREAVDAANENPFADTIIFRIPGTGPHVIHLYGSLWIDGDGTTIDGTTQPGYSADPAPFGTPAVIVDAGHLLEGREGTGWMAFWIVASDTTIRGLQLAALEAGAMGPLVEISHVEPSGGSNNVVERNIIGLNPDGSAGPGQSVVLARGSSVVRNNIIVARGSGIGVESGTHTIQGNWIGLNPAGDAAYEDFAVGIRVRGGETLIGGRGPGEGNVISGAGEGIQLWSSGSEVIGNRIGTNAAGTAALSTGEVGIEVWGEENVIRTNLISGYRVGILLGYTGSAGELTYLYTARNALVQGNFIGTDAAGTAALPNGKGIVVGPEVETIVIGGADPSQANIISGNGIGIEVQGGTPTILGNRVGTNAAGTAAIPNEYGIIVWDRATGMQIGGSAPGEGNLISGNTRTGLWLRNSSSLVQGNWFGLTVDGASALPNGTGLDVDGDSNQIGGSGAGAANVISGNEEGVVVSGGSNLLLGNTIGLDPTGALAIPNDVGMYLAGDDNTLGSTAAPNLISGNGRGLVVTGSHNAIYDNRVGTDLTAVAELPNGVGIELFGPYNQLGNGVLPGNQVLYNNGPGIRVSSTAVGNTIAGNTIAFNAQEGIRVEPGAGVVSNTFTHNSVYQNVWLGIDLLPGAQDDIAAPTIESITVASESTAGAIHGQACPGCQVEAFYADPDPSGAGEGRTFYQAGPADGSGNFTFPIPPGHMIGICQPLTATATDAEGNTSEFSTNVTPFGCLHVPWIYIMLGIPALVVVGAGAGGLAGGPRGRPAMGGAFGGAAGGLIGAVIAIALFRLPFVQIVGRQNPEGGGSPVAPAPPCAQFVNASDLRPESGAVFSLGTDVLFELSPQPDPPGVQTRWTLQLSGPAGLDLAELLSGPSTSLSALGVIEPAPGAYAWRLSAERLDGQTNEWKPFCADLSDRSFFLLQPTPAVTPSTVPLAHVLQNANCRSGPGVFYPLVASVAQGESFPIQGRNLDGTWWWIDRPDGDCWLADSVVETEGDTSQVPPQQAPPTPTITPVLGCWQRPVQGPLRCVVPCPETEQNPSWCTP